MKIIAKITDPKVIRRFLAAIDLPTEAPRIGWDDELYAEPSANTDMDGAC